MYRIGWFSTGRDKAARDLLEVAHNAVRKGEIKAEIAFVFCSRDPGESRESDLFIEQVKSYHIPLVCFSYEKFKATNGILETEKSGTLPSWRLDYDRAVMDLLHGFQHDLCVLAGYMLIVGREMCQKYNMINLHPAAPGGPAGTWQEVVWQLIERKAQKTGVMMHLVTPELDRGPVVTYCIFSIRGGLFDKYWREIDNIPVDQIKKKQGEDNPLFNLIRKHGLAREFPLILATLKAFSEGRVRITPDKKVVDAEGKPIRGYDLTDEIERQLTLS